MVLLVSKDPLAARVHGVSKAHKVHKDLLVLQARLDRLDVWDNLEMLESVVLLESSAFRVTLDLQDLREVLVCQDLLEHQAVWAHQGQVDYRE